MEAATNQKPLTIDPELKALIPPLAPDELVQLEANLVEHGGARDPLVVWANAGALVLLDGHNRHEICTRLGLAYRLHELPFADKDAAADWMDKNQLGRRNLKPDQFMLLLGRRYNRASKGHGAPTGNNNANKNKVPNFGTLFSPGKTATKLAREHGVASSTVRLAGAFARAVTDAKKVDPDIEAKVAAGTAPAKSAVIKAAAILDTNPERAAEILQGRKKMADVIREEKRASVVAKLEDVEARKAKEIAGVFDVLVIDPPWPMEKIERDVTPEQVAFEYPTMQEDELAKLHVPAADDCHVWLWTTHKYLPMSFRLLEAWKLKYVCAFVWHKNGGFQPFGLPQYNCEFALYARRGTPQFIDTKAFNVCFNAPRGKHSEKPEEFYEVVRRVTAGRRLDMFNRRAIEGFETWGKEASE